MLNGKQKSDANIELQKQWIAASMRAELDFADFQPLRNRQ